MLPLAAAAEAAPNSATTQILIAALSAGGFGAIISAIIAGLFSKRKIGAEATDIITKAASGVVTNMQNEIDRLVARNKRLEENAEVDRRMAQDSMRSLVHQHELEMEEVRRVLQLHVAWDAIAIAKMNEFGVKLPPAPPLLPPSQTSYAHEDL
jgi:hypothetical protein